ncbi:MAG: hypothetical protein M1838_001538 [Thelocarpon superellum]|nr:MAG: hypothetical protein M1838_001538 [Thelocarpon superellum]
MSAPHPHAMNSSPGDRPSSKSSAVDRVNHHSPSSHRHSFPEPPFQLAAQTPSQLHPQPPTFSPYSMPTTYMTPPPHHNSPTPQAPSSRTRYGYAPPSPVRPHHSTSRNAAAFLMATDPPSPEAMTRPSSTLPYAIPTLAATTSHDTSSMWASRPGPSPSRAASENMGQTHSRPRRERLFRPPSPVPTSAPTLQGPREHSYPRTSYAGMMTTGFVPGQNPRTTTTRMADLMHADLAGEAVSRTSRSQNAFHEYIASGRFERNVNESYEASRLTQPGQPLRDLNSFLAEGRVNPHQERNARAVPGISRFGDGPDEYQPLRVRRVPGIPREERIGGSTTDRDADDPADDVAVLLPLRREIELASVDYGADLRRASRKAIETLVDVDLNSLDEDDRACSICLERLGMPEPTQGKIETPVKLPCGHVFGKNCIKTWFGEHCTCPSCRRKVESELYRPDRFIRRRLAARLTQQQQVHNAASGRASQVTPMSTSAPSHHSTQGPLAGPLVIADVAAENASRAAQRASQAQDPDAMMIDAPSPTHDVIGGTRIELPAYLGMSAVGLGPPVRSNMVGVEEAAASTSFQPTSHGYFSPSAFTNSYYATPSGSSGSSPSTNRTTAQGTSEHFTLPAHQGLGVYGQPRMGPRATPMRDSVFNMALSGRFSTQHPAAQGGFVPGFPPPGTAAINVPGVPDLIQSPYHRGHRRSRRVAGPSASDIGMEEQDRPGRS